MALVSDVERTTHPLGEFTQYCEAVRPSPVAPLQSAMDRARQTPITSLNDTRRREAWEAALLRGVETVTAIITEFPPQEAETDLPRISLPEIRRKVS